MLEEYPQKTTRYIDSPNSRLFIEELELSVRSYNCLKRAGINTIGDLAQMNEDDLMKIRSLGRTMYDEIVSKIRIFGINEWADGKPVRITGELIYVSELGLTKRTINVLDRAGIRTIEELAGKTENEVMKLHRLGDKSIEEIRAKMLELGFVEWGDGEPISDDGYQKSNLSSKNIVTSRSGDRIGSLCSPEAIEHNQHNNQAGSAGALSAGINMSKAEKRREGTAALPVEINMGKVEKRHKGTTALPVEINMGKVEKRREELVQTTDMLSSEETDDTVESIAESEIVEDSPGESFDGIEGFIDSLLPSERALLYTLLNHADAGSFPDIELLVESINEKAQYAINDVIIGVSGGQYSVYDDYCDDLLEAEGYCSSPAG